MPVKSSVPLPKNLEKAPATMQIVEYLRGQIVSGKLASADRLPTQRALKEQFSTSKTTVESAFEILAKEGFISGKGTHGTFVANHPPHTSRYALAFPCAWEEVAASPFWTKLCEEAEKNEAPYNYKVSFFYDINPVPVAADYHRLRHEIRTHQLAGLIYAANPEFISRTTSIESLGIPVVAISIDATECFAPLVQISYDSFFDRALDYLAQSGKKRVAVFTPAIDHPHRQHFTECATGKGLITFPHWWLPLPIDTNSTAFTARAYVQLLMSEHQTLRPDALIIADDTFVKPTLHGLKEMGIRIPQDMEIITLNNFPAAFPPEVAMQRIGYSVRQILQSCLELINLQRTGQPVPPLTVIKAIAEEEIE